jgi:hypothetical protein
MLTLNTIRLTSFVISNALSLFLISSHTSHTFSDSALMSVFFGYYLYIIYKKNSMIPRLTAIIDYVMS